MKHIKSYLAIISSAIFFLIIFGGIKAVQAQEPWQTPQGRACIDQWANEAMRRINSYDGGSEFNARKPWFINRYGILNGNPKYGPTSTAAPDDFGRYGNDKYRYMWYYWYVPSGYWRWPEWRGAGVPQIRPYVQRCIRQAGGGTVSPQPPGGGITGARARCDQYARTAVSQNHENVRRGCGYTGARWSNNYQGHYNWCLNASQSTADSETRARQEGLRKCRGTGGQTRRAKLVSLQSYNYPNHFIRHRNFLGEITEIRTDLDRKDSTFIIVPGLADSRYISFESVNYPGYYLRHQNFRVKLHKYSNDQLFRKDTTFRPVPGLANSTWSSFESFNYPGYYIRHKNFHLYIERGNDDLFRKDVTFRLANPNIRSITQQGTGGQTRRGKIEWNIDRMGSDITSFNLQRADPSLCQDACDREPRCKAWTYVKPNTIQGPKPRCWLKHSVPLPRKSNCCASGVK